MSSLRTPTPAKEPSLSRLLDRGLIAVRVKRESSKNDVRPVDLEGVRRAFEMMLESDKNDSQQERAA